MKDGAVAMVLLTTRLSDLHWAINSHAARHPSLSTPTTDDECTLTQGVWPVGSTDLRGGKKGDIFRLVRKFALQSGLVNMWCFFFYRE